MRSALGNSDAGTGAAAQRRVGFYFIDYIQLFPCNGLEVAHKAARQDQAGSGEENGAKTGAQIQTGAMQVKLGRQRVARLILQLTATPCKISGDISPTSLPAA